jgi:hypothetical protein
VPIAVLVASLLDTEALALTEAVLVTIMAFDALRTVKSCEQRVADANIFVLFILDALSRADSVTIAV